MVVFYITLVTLLRDAILHIVLFKHTRDSTVLPLQERKGSSLYYYLLKSSIYIFSVV